VRPRDRELAGELNASFRDYAAKKRPLPGIADEIPSSVLVEQILESIHRIKFVQVMSHRDVSERRADPNDELFDPLKSAILHQRRGEIEEAYWLVFLFVHFGKNPKGGWRFAREVYGRLGEGERWDWANTIADPAGFRVWLQDHQAQLKRPGVPGGFGNHRKYESLNGDAPTGTGAAVESYVAWVNPPRSHQDLVRQALEDAHGDPKDGFERLYQSMEAVTRFGRTARFDYLTMLGKLGLAAIEPGSTYMQGATGPVKGATRLFGVGTISELDEWLVELDVVLKVGMQVLEDALCNWQKSPEEFIPFRG
jgi:hypothetical protein